MCVPDEKHVRRRLWIRDICGRILQLLWAFCKYILYLCGIIIIIIIVSIIIIIIIIMIAVVITIYFKK